MKNMTRQTLLRKGMIGVVTLLLLSMMAAYIIDGAKPVFANAITIYSSQNWSAITTGSGSGGQPSSTDTITINSGATLIVNIPNAVCASITFNAPSSSGGLNISGTNTLTVGGAIIMNAPTYASTTTLSVGTGTLNAGSIAIKAGTSVSDDSILSVSTGTINVTGAITFSGTAAQAHLTFNGAGTLNIGGNLGTGGAFTCSTGTVNFNGSSAQTFGGYTYNILKSNNTAGITPAAACTITTLILADVTSGSIFNDGGYPISTATTLNLNSGTYYCTTPTFPWGTLNSNTGTVNYSGTGQTLKVTSYYNLTLSGGAETFGAITTIGGNLTLSGSATATTGANLTVSGNLAVGDGTTFTVNGFTLTVTGTTNVGGGGTGGSLVFSSATNPNKTFIGLVTINTNSSLTESAAITPTFSNGITNSGSFTASTGVHIFSTNSQGLTGTFTIPSVTVTSPAVLTNNNTLTVGTALSGTGGLTQAANATLNIGGTSGITTLTATNTGNTVNYTGAAQTIKAINYYNLTLSGSGTDVLQTGTTIISGNLTLSGTVSTTAVIGLNIGGIVTLGSGTTFTGGSFTHNVAGNWINNGGTFTNTGNTINFNGTTQTIDGSASTTFNNLSTSGSTNTNPGIATIVSGNLNIGDGTTFTVGAYALTVTGATTVGGGTSGNLTVSSATGAKLFTGLVTISAGATWNNSGNSPVEFRGGITNSGTFTAGTGLYTFDTNSQALTGTFSIPSVTVTSPAVLTNTNTLTIGTALSGTGGLTQSASATLNIGGTSGITALIATNTGNTVNYTGAAGQTVFATTYYNLTLSGSGATAMTSGTSVTTGGTLNIAPTGSATASIGAGLNLTVYSLSLGSMQQTSGTWGSTSSAATYQNNTYFDMTTGYLTVSTGIGTGPLDHFSISSISSPQTAGTALTGITLTAQDAGNKTVASFTGTVTYTGTAGITGTSASFTLGQLTGVSVTPTVTGTGMTLIVTGSGKTGTSSFNVNPGAVDHFLISDISSPQTAGTAITGIMLTAQDLNNNTTTSFTGTVTYSGTAGITGTSASFTLGLLTGVSVTPTVAGTGMTFIVTGPGKTGTSTFTVNAGMATKLAYTTVPSTGTAGTAFSVTVQSQDANGNPSNLASATTITLSKATGGGTLSGMLTGSIGIGSSSVTIATPVYSKADMMTLTASASGGVTLTAITSGNIVFSAGAATQVIVETAADGSGTVVPAQDVNTGNSITVYAITRDASNNFVANIAVSWSLVGKTGGVANGDLAASGDTKSAIFTANYNGNAQIEAISGSLTQINSGTITVPVILIVTAPSAINLNVLVVGQTTTGYSVTSGSVVSNYANWSVSATDASGGTKTTNYGYMTTNADGSGSKLTDAFRIGKVSGNYYASNSPGLTYNGAGDGSLPFYVSQSVVSNDAAGLYTITITFIVSTP